MRRLNSPLFSFDDRPDPTIDVGPHVMSVHAVIACAANRGAGGFEHHPRKVRPTLRAINGRPC